MLSGGISLRGMGCGSFWGRKVRKGASDPVSRDGTGRCDAAAACVRLATSCRAGPDCTICAIDNEYTYTSRLRAVYPNNPTRSNTGLELLYTNPRHLHPPLRFEAISPISNHLRSTQAHPRTDV